METIDEHPQEMSTAFNITDAEYEQLALHVQELIEKVEGLPFPKVRDDVFDLLQGFDALHREALARLLQLIVSEAPSLIPKVEEDFVIRTLLILYDFLPQEAEPEASLPKKGGFVPLDQVDILEEIRMPIWMPGGHLSDLEPGTLMPKKFEGVSVLFCRIEDEVFALLNACVGSILTLEQGRLEGYTLVCPWHDCHYDVRSGELQDGSGQKVQTFPVEIGPQGRFSVGFNINP